MGDTHFTMYVPKVVALKQQSVFSVCLMKIWTTLFHCLQLSVFGESYCITVSWLINTLSTALMLDCVDVYMIDVASVV